MATKSDYHHSAKIGAMANNAKSLLDCFRFGGTDLAFALCENKLITSEHREGTPQCMVDAVEHRLKFDEETWERLINVLKNMKFDSVVEKLLASFKELHVVCPSFSTNVFQYDAWIPTERSSAAKPLSGQPVSSSIAGAAGRQGNDSGIVMKADLSWSTLESKGQVDTKKNSVVSTVAPEVSPLLMLHDKHHGTSHSSISQHSVNDQASATSDPLSSEIVPPYSAGTQISLSSAHFDESEGQVGTRKNIVVSTFAPVISPLLMSHNEHHGDSHSIVSPCSVHGQASADDEPFLVQATTASDPLSSEIVPPQTAATQISLSLALCEEKRKNQHLQQELMLTTQRDQRQIEELRKENEVLKKEKEEERDSYRKEINCSMRHDEEMISKKQDICHLLDKLSMKDKVIDMLKAQLDKERRRSLALEMELHMSKKLDQK